MLNQIEEMRAEVLAVEASDNVSQEDYPNPLIPRLEAIMGSGPVRKLAVSGKELTGFDLRAMADDARCSFGRLHDFSQIAVASYRPGLNTMRSLFSPFFHGEVRTFGLKAMSQAKNWIKGGKL